MLSNLIKIELYKIFRKPRSYIGIAVIVFIVVLIELSIWIDGQRILDFITQNLYDSFYFQGNLLNGYLISYLVLNTLWIHVPVLVAFVAGDIISGEAANGTLRTVLSRPVKRTHLLFAKFVANISYSTLLVLILSFLSLFFGLLIFGKGDLIVITNKINILPQQGLMLRFIYAFGFGVLSMAVISTLSFMFSAFGNNSIGPIIGTIAVIIGFNIISSFQLPIFNNIRPYLFTTYLNSWFHFFSFNLDKDLILKSILHLSANMLIFFLITIISFRRKDILT